jgi:uncharacterized protein YqkB
MNKEKKANDSEMEPDGFHGKSYAAFIADTEKCKCEGGVTTYGMVCVDCGKPYQMKTQFTVNSSAGEWHGKE